MHHPTDKIAHTTAFVTPVVEHWLEREIAQWVHPLKDRSNDPSHHERMLLPRSYISLLTMSECSYHGEMSHSFTIETHWWMMPGGDTGTCLLLGDLDVRGRNISGQVIPWNRETFLSLFTVQGRGFPIKYKNGRYYFLIIWMSSE